MFYLSLVVLTFESATYLIITIVSSQLQAEMKKELTEKYQKKNRKAITGIFDEINIPLELSEINAQQNVMIFPPPQKPERTSSHRPKVIISSADEELPSPDYF
jgi:hypothetical protein